jgi:hypothetical protein
MDDIKQDRLEAAEQDRQAAQAGAHTDQRQADADSAPDRAADAQAEAGMDPNSPEGRQAAIRRGDPVQLQGEEGARGMVQGTSTTTNESGAGFPASDEHRFVTGASGMPIPASAGVDPQVPGDFNPPPNPHPDAGAPEVARPPQEQAMAQQDEGSDGPPPKSAPKAEWVEHVAATTDLTEEEAAAKTKAELIEQGTGSEDTGDHGPGVSQ